MLNVPPRSEVDPKYQWNAPSVFENAAAWKTAYEATAADLPGALAKFQGHLGDSPAALADWFDAYGAMFKRVGKVMFYALMSQACDTTNVEASAMAGQAGGLMGRFQAAAAFAEPELLALGEDTLRGWVKDEPRLSSYGHYLEDLFRRQQHVRSAEVEELLAIGAGDFCQYREHQRSADQRRNRLPASHQRDGGQPGQFEALRTSPDRELRRTA